MPGGSTAGSATPSAAAGLPAIVFPAPAASDSRYNLTYTLNADLGAAPKSAYAYQVTWRTFSRAEFEQLARALGVPGPVQVTAGGFVAFGNGRLTLNNGLLTYMSPLAVGTGDTTPTAVPTPTGTASPTATGTAAMGTATASTAAATPSTTTATPSTTTTTPSASATPTGAGATPTPTPTDPAADATARATAKDWLKARGLLPANVDAGEVWRPVADQTVVIFHPLEPQGRILGDPQVLVVFDPAGNVRMIQYHWPASSTPALSRLRPAQEAWADLQAGKGYTQVEWTVPDGTAPGSTFTGAATVTKVTVGWSSAVNAAGQTYLLPVYVFEGTTTIAGTSVTAPFRAYARAIAP